MKATIDGEGRIALGPDVQSQLGVKPGDEVVLENRGGDVIIKAAKAATGLCYEGNVLVHRGVSPVRKDELLSTTRDERFEQLREGLPR
jgi:formylmethanofuran dehydrogenase subunit D